MTGYCLLLWISVVGCNPVAQNYLDVASAVPSQHLALVREIEITNAGHAYVTSKLGRISLPARRDGRPLYSFTHEVGHLVFNANEQDLMLRWLGWFWWDHMPTGQISGYSARVLATGDWWQAAKEDAADSYAAIFSGDALDSERRMWLCEQVEGLAELPSCGAALR